MQRDPAQKETGADAARRPPVVLRGARRLRREVDRGELAAGAPRTVADARSCAPGPGCGMTAVNVPSRVMLPVATVPAPSLIDATNRSARAGTPGRATRRAGAAGRTRRG